MPALKDEHRDLADSREHELEIIRDAEKRYKQNLEFIQKVKEAAIKNRAVKFESLERRKALLNRNIRLSKAHHFETLDSEVDKEKYEELLKKERSNFNQNTTERGIGNIGNIISIEFLERGLEVGQAVGKIEIKIAGIEFFGTGFLVGKDLMITNHHVLLTKSHVSNARIKFNYEDNLFGTPKKVLECTFDPDRFFYEDARNDFAIVAVKVKKSDRAILRKLYTIPLLESEGKINVDHAVNVIHHPNGKTKSISVHDSKLLYLENKNDEDDQYCFYSSDTETGSSGSPVFNNRWEVIALHQKGVPDRNNEGKLLDRKGNILEGGIKENEDLINWICNQGIRTSRIVKSFRKAELIENFSTIRDEIVEEWDDLNI